MFMHYAFDAGWVGSSRPSGSSGTATDREGCSQGKATRNDAVLAVQFEGLTIADVLSLSVQDAVERFAATALSWRRFRPVSEVGLGYLKLDEPTAVAITRRIAAAEDRLQAAQQPARRAGRLRRFDQGLHPLGIAMLVGVFNWLIDAGARSS